VRDSEIVASIVAGAPEGLAQAFDRYATPLFAYSSAQLREPADAAAVVRDTFRVAAGHLAGLREPAQLRAWLFAVARIRCLSLIESGEARSAIGMPPEEPAQLHALLRAALGGLSEAERDVALLMLWHGLGNGETAAGLGVSRRRVHFLLTRARRQLGTSLGTLLVARMGRNGCGVLDVLLTGWDGRLTEVVRNRLSRHIKDCAACTERQRRELESALLGQGHGTALTSVLKEAPAAGSIPPGLRAAVLSADTDGAAAAAVSGPAVPLRKDGFPEPPTQPRPRKWKMTLVPALAVAVVALTAMFITLDPVFHGGSSAIGARPGAPSAPDLDTPGGGGGTGPGGGSTQPVPGPSGSGPSTHRSTGVTVVITSPAPRTGGTGGTGGTGSSAPSNSATAIPTSGSPTSSPAPAPAPTPSPGATSTPAGQGTLYVSPTTVALTLSAGGTITLTAENGPVSWSIAEPSSLLGEVTVAPASGTLEAGQNTQVTITVSGLASLDTDLTVNPGGQQITVLLGVGL